MPSATRSVIIYAGGKTAGARARKAGRAAGPCARLAAGQPVDGGDLPGRNGQERRQPVCDGPEKLADGAAAVAVFGRPLDREAGGGPCSRPAWP